MKYPEDFFRDQEQNLWLPKQDYSEFNYSDGSEEETYLETCIRKVSDLSCHSSELVRYIHDWSSEYHLSPKRSNLLRPILLDKGSSILELGAGCGAVTRYLGENAAKVVAVEGSEKRARIAALRCRDLANVQVVHGQFQDVKFPEKFDVVTLIGVLEYSGKYINSINQHQQVLEIARHHLKDDGVLILAIENKLGLKYFAGCPEDHSGILFDGIEGYSSGSLIKTFGKQELESLLQISGFKNVHFLYPFPDYKLPDVVIKSDESNQYSSIPFLYNWLGYINSRNYTSRKIEIFQEFLVFKQIEANGLLSQVSNSFLVLAGKEQTILQNLLEPEQIVWKYNVMRNKEFMTQVCLRRNGDDGSLFVKREPIYTEPTLKSQGTNTIEELKHYAYEYTELISGTTLVELMILAIRSSAPGDEQFLNLRSYIKVWYDFLVKEAQQCLGSETELPGSYVDCTPWNLIVPIKGDINYIDREWSYLELLPIKFILFRGLLGIYHWVYLWIDAGFDILKQDKSFRAFLNFCLQLVGLDINSEEFKRFANLEWKFQNKIKLFSSESFEEFTNFLNSVPQSMLIIKSVERAHSQLQHTQAELERAHSQLQQTQAKSERAHSQLQQTQAELERSQLQVQQSQLQLQATQGELAQSQLQLQATQGELAQSQLQLQATQGELVRSQTTIVAIESSKFWKLRTVWFRLRRAFGLVEDDRPLHRSLWSRGKYLWAVFRTKGFRHSLAKLLKKTYQKLDYVEVSVEALPQIPHSDDVNYQQWLNKNYPRQADLRKMAEAAELLGYKPLISVVMPVFNTPTRFLREAIESVLNQVYPYWELCIADDASTKTYIKPLLEEYAAKDTRIKVVFRHKNGHISEASNSALEIAAGEFVALLDHDDLLTPDALYEVALLLNRHPHADMIYSDEDKIREDGSLKEPFFKPDWCPDSFLSRMYTSHLGTYRRALVTEIGGFRAGYEGSQDYDFVLRLTEKTENIFHIPKILYHWRIHSESTASSLTSKNYATNAAQKALSDALSRRGESGKVVPVPGGHHIVRYEIKDSKLVSVIIPTRNLGNILNKCLASIFEKTSYPNYEVLVIDNGSNEDESLSIINQWRAREPNRFRCEVLDIPFNYSKINNYAVQQAKGEYLLFLNNDTEVLTPDWMDAMVEQAQRPSIGAVGCLLLYPDNTIQHAGVVGVGGVAGHSHKHYPSDSHGYFNQIRTVNNYSAVTAACLMCRREVFEAVGGFEEKLIVSLNDVDLCLKIVEQGYRNIYLPHVVLYHYESKSRGYEDTPEKQARFIKEVEYMQIKWKKFIDHDPCYSPNLTRKREDYSINV